MPNQSLVGPCILCRKLDVALGSLTRENITLQFDKFWNWWPQTCTIYCWWPLVIFQNMLRPTKQKIFHCDFSTYKRHSSTREKKIQIIKSTFHSLHPNYMCCYCVFFLLEKALMTRTKSYWKIGRAKPTKEAMRWRQYMKGLTFNFNHPFCHIWAINDIKDITIIDS